MSKSANIPIAPRWMAVVAAAALLVAAGPWVAAASRQPQETPLQFVERNVNKVLEILRSCHTGSKCGLKERRHRLALMADEIFDFDSIARRALGRNVHRFSPEEFKRFSREFATLLKNYYISKIDAYSNEKVAFDKEIELAPGYYQVNTRIIMSDKEIPLVYRLERKDGGWRVYDVLIEGVSMVKNYRSQFDRILRRKSPAFLIGLVEKKNAHTKYK